MAEEKSEQKMKEKKKTETAEVTKKVEKKTESNVESKSEKKTSPKKNEKPKVKKFETVAYGRSLPISKKHGMYICSFIKNKEIDKALSELALVIDFKKAVPFKGEIPHRKGKGMMSGRYPVKAAKLFINLLKALRGNVLVNGMELEKTRITIASTSWASRPMRTGGRLAKRTNVLLKAKEFSGGKK